MSPRPARRRRWPLALAVLAFALSVGIPIFLRARSTDSPNGRTANPAAASAPVVVRPSSTGSDPRSPARAALVAWAQRSLSPEAVIVSDSATVSQLRGAGFTSSLSFDDVGSRPVQTVDYVFDIPGAVPSALPAARARAKLIRLSLPLATFSAARSAPTARQVFPDGTAPVQRRQASSEEVQRIAGRELLQNPAVVPDAATKTALQNGDLDLRAETVLSDLATTDLVYVTDPVTNAAEARAGRPIRSVVVTTSDSQAAQSVLSSMVSPYRPDTVQSISPRKLRLSWQPAIGLATTVGQ